jgi:hypothetical protein
MDSQHGLMGIAIPWVGHVLSNHKDRFDCTDRGIFKYFMKKNIDQNQCRLQIIANL